MQSRADGGMFQADGPENTLPGGGSNAEPAISLRNMIRNSLPYRSKPLSNMWIPPNHTDKAIDAVQAAVAWTPSKFRLPLAVAVPRLPNAPSAAFGSTPLCGSRRKFQVVEADLGESRWFLEIEGHGAFRNLDSVQQFALVTSYRNFVSSHASFKGRYCGFTCAAGRGDERTCIAKP